MVLGRVVRLLADEVTEQVTGSLLTCGFGGWDFHMLYPHVSKLVPLCFPLSPNYIPRSLLVWAHSIMESKRALL